MAASEIPAYQELIAAINKNIEELENNIPTPTIPATVPADSKPIDDKKMNVPYKIKKKK